MKLEDQLVCKELSQKIKELGFPQDSLWYWEGIMTDVNKIRWKINRANKNHNPNKYSAFTVAELSDLMKNKYIAVAPDLDDGAYGRYEESVHCGWTATNPRYIRKLVKVIKDENQANCLAKMLIYLRENKLI